jgi:IMP dehydrogenase
VFAEALSFDDVLLVPKFSAVESRDNVKLHTSVAGVPLGIPIISANMATITEGSMALAMATHGGLGAIHRMNDPLMQSLIVQDVVNSWANAPVAYSFGLKDWKERVEKNEKAGATLAILDVAHADHMRAGKVAYEYVYMSEGRLIVGNIATPEAVEYYWNLLPPETHHRVAFKVGIGGGSLCTTRVQTGCGIPTFQSVYDIHEKFPYACLIADGGIKSAGDIVKALAAGASAVMLGSLLAGTDETPGDVIRIDESDRRFKTYRGSASYADKRHRGDATRNVEGVESLVPYKGPVARVLQTLTDGIRSGCSYQGVTNIKDLSKYPQFVRISQSGYRESIAHGVV